MDLLKDSTKSAYSKNGSPRGSEDYLIPINRRTDMEKKDTAYHLVTHLWVKLNGGWS